MVQGFVESEEFKTRGILSMEGKLANPPEYKQTTRAGHPTCKLTFLLKCEGFQECNKEPAYWNWHAMGNLAIACSELKQGQWLSVAGRISANRWGVEGGGSKLSIHGVIFRIGVRPAPKSKEIKWLGHQKDGEPPTEPEVEVAAPNGPSAIEAFIAH